MDNLAHTLIGVGVARAGLSERFGKGTTWTLAIASNLPDLDVLWTVWNPWDLMLGRRTESHSLLAAPLLAAGLAAVMGLFFKSMNFQTRFLLSLLGIGLHLLFDLVNSYGVVVLWPFSWNRYEMPCVFIIDLGIWAILLAPILWARWRPGGATRPFRIALAALGVYVGLCASASLATRSVVAAETADVKPGTIKVFPEPLGPWNFRAAVKDGSSWRLYRVTWPAGRTTLAAMVPTDEDSERVREVRAGHDGCKLDWFMAAPVWTREADGAVIVRDLRFHPLVLPWRPDRFRFEFPPGSDRARPR